MFTIYVDEAVTKNSLETWELPQFFKSMMTLCDAGHVQGASCETDEVLVWTDISDRAMKIRQYAIRIEHRFIILWQGQGCLTAE